VHLGTVRRDEVSEGLDARRWGLCKAEVGLEEDGWIVEERYVESDGVAEGAVKVYRVGHSQGGYGGLLERGARSGAETLIESIACNDPTIAVQETRTRPGRTVAFCGGLFPASQDKLRWRSPIPPSLPPPLRRCRVGVEWRHLSSCHRRRQHVGSSPTAVSAAST
jgi:hypothetical protein